MKVVDEGRMLLNGQGQGSGELNSNHIKAEAEVREQSDALDFVKGVMLCCHHHYFHITISHII